jgi:hypothetical protein
MELNRYQEKEYNLSKQIDKVIFKLYYMKMLHSKMLNSVPEGFNNANDATEELQDNADRLKASLERLSNEFAGMVHMVENDHDDMVDRVPF